LSETPQSIVIVTGLSGSGKSYVNKCFEDMGYFCVDNLPLSLVDSLLDDLRSRRTPATRIAVVLDVRNPNFAERFPEMFRQIKERFPSSRLVFLDASEESLIRRFSETRRPHPLAGDRALLEALRHERRQLENVRAMADLVIDTSALTVHELRSAILKTFKTGEDSGSMVVSITSFGFKFGVPHDVDLLFDVRFLANPHFVPELKPKTGEDAAVAAYIEQDAETAPFLEHLDAFLEYLIPRYEREHKSYLSIGIGCTGGKHRSVYIAGRLAAHLREMGYPVRVSHRDAMRE
jgi:RNase adapter protein RapZ